MRRKSATILFLFVLMPLFLVAALFPAPSAATDISIPQVQASIKSCLNGQSTDRPLSIQIDSMGGMKMIPLAYRSRSYMPFWIDPQMHLNSARALIEAIERAGEDGLVSADYHLAAIHRLLAELAKARATTQSVLPEQLADLDLTLTDAFLLLGTHLSIGKVDPKTLLAKWMIDPGRVTLLPSLNQAATGDVAATLRALRPSHKGYAALLNALAQLRKIAEYGGWAKLSDEPVLRPGDRGAGVEALRRRLLAGWDLEPYVQVNDAQRFDDGLVEAVKRFQRRHGLDDDGVVGPGTVGLLNVSVEERIRQVEINLERWRWLPHQMEARYVVVNMADFTLDAVDAGQTVLTMRVVVGRPARRSPVFSSNISHMVVNPYWTIPTTIAVEDILPAVQEDVDYLTERGIRVYSTWQAKVTEVDPATIDWQVYHKDRFPFTLRQDPGPRNALGRIKFMFPNAHEVYLHGTPDHTIFNQIQRDTSSGCIRLEDPQALANFLLSGDSRWTPQKLTKQVESGKPLKIQLDPPVPVHLLYMTAWTDASGVLQFREDIYRRDSRLAKALGLAYPFQVLKAPVSR
jgi:L,D-transpeptidase YcbB